jgi:hypothetical protein
MREQFSELQTEWRRTQSAANPSPGKIPVNREKYREFDPLNGLHRIYSPVNTEVTGFQSEIGTGNEQEKNRRDNREKASRNRSEPYPQSLERIKTSAKT